MRAIVVAGAVLCAACSANAADLWQWQAPDRYEVAVLVAANASIAADCLYSLDIKHHPEMSEGNPFLPKHPSDAQYALAGAAAMTITSAAWLALPHGWRMIVPAGVLGGEILNLMTLHHLGLTMRF